MAQCGLITKNIIKMYKAKRILEEALSYKNCDGLIDENSRLEDAVLYAINQALHQPLVSGELPSEEELKQIFFDNFDCYADSPNVIPAMTMDRFVEVFKSIFVRNDCKRAVLP